MAFICCDDHSVSIEADGIDPDNAKRLMLDNRLSAKDAIEQEVKEFGREHRECNIRVLAD